MMTLSKVWIDDLGLGPGDRLDVYREAEDRLIILAARPEQKEELPFGAGQRSKK